MHRMTYQLPLLAHDCVESLGKCIRLAKVVQHELVDCDLLLSL